MDLEHAELFKILDQHVKAHHQCFVAECDFERGRSEWRLCLRPTNENPVLCKDALACRYIRLSMKEAEQVCARGDVPVGLAEKISYELRSISG